MSTNERRIGWRAKATIANVAAGLVVLFGLSGTAAAATLYVISSNSQVGPATIAGHHPPTGDHANVIAGSINGTDLQAGSVGAAQLAAPEPWHVVGLNPSTGVDPCTKGAIATFCGNGNPPGDTSPSRGNWANTAAPFAPGAFYRDAQSRVHLRGLVSFAYAGLPPDHAPVFYLPVGYRPGHELVFATLDNDSAGSYLARVDVDPSGAVHLVNDGEFGYPGSICCGATYLSLDGISFRVGE